MVGARMYATLFNTGQYGQLYITRGSHARGYTFRIQVLPKGEKAVPNGDINPCLNSNAVEVYGVLSGTLGWSEEYGWTHKGKWQEDFEKLVLDRLKELDDKVRIAESLKESKERQEMARIKALLDSYLK